MSIGNLVGWEPGANSIFDPHCDRNRDDCLEPWRVLRAAFAARGTSLDTADVNLAAGRTADFNLYLEPLDVATAPRNYLLRFECELIVPRNSDPAYLGRFDAVFTWDRRAVDGRRFVHMNYPNPLVLPTRFGFEGRTEFCTMICANKTATVQDGRELYSRRVEALRWFERHAPERFNLYGIGWDKPPKRPGALGRWRYRAEKAWHRLTGTPPVPSYRGRIAAKREVLERSRFCICFENAQGIEDYVTEKLFDALFAGCVPVYWGAPNIRALVPPECYVDYREFGDMAALYRHLDAMTETEYLARQRAILAFLQGPGFEPYSSQAFARVIVDKVLADLAGAPTLARATAGAAR